MPVLGAGRGLVVVGTNCRMWAGGIDLVGPDSVCLRGVVEDAHVLQGAWSQRTQGTRQLRTRAPCPLCMGPPFEHARGGASCTWPLRGDQRFLMPPPSQQHTGPFDQHTHPTPQPLITPPSPPPPPPHATGTPPAVLVPVSPAPAAAPSFDPGQARQRRIEQARKIKSPSPQATNAGLRRGLAPLGDRGAGQAQGGRGHGPDVR